MHRLPGSGVMVTAAPRALNRQRDLHLAQHLVGRRYILLVAVVMVVGCRTLAGQTGGAVIPRDSRASRAADMNYSPVDRALEWPSADTLYISHEERYAYADLADARCDGSGIYTVGVTAERAVAIAIGEPACRVVGEMVPALASRERLVLSSATQPGNRTALLRFRLPAGPLDTIRTGCAVYAEDPDVSPDGQRIAFKGLCRGRQQRHWALYIVGMDGSALRPVAADDDYETEWPRWSPDGARLAYERRKTDTSSVTEIAIVNATGDNRRVLARGSWPAWSRDGRWLAFGSLTRGNEPNEIHVIRADGSGERSIFRNGVRSTYSRGWGPMLEGQVAGPLVWSPDGQWIAFSRSFDRGMSVWRVNARTGEVRQVTRAAR